MTLEISIHAPLTGSDWICCWVDHPAMISIHAPLTGSDVRRSICSSLSSNFNPRSPYGERQQDCTKFYLGFCLSSTIL